MSDEERFPDALRTLRHRGKFRATIKIRRDGQFGKVRPVMEPYDGISGVFTELWFIDCREDEFANPAYHGEHAMEVPDFHNWPIGWLASGDLINVVPVDGGPLGPDDDGEELEVENIEDVA